MAIQASLKFCFCFFLKFDVLFIIVEEQNPMNEEQAKLAQIKMKRLLQSVYLKYSWNARRWLLKPMLIF